MSSLLRPLIACTTLVILITGCDGRDPDAAQGRTIDSAATPLAPVTDTWVGKWTGPEGTFLQLTGGNGQYQGTIQNLDGPRTFQGHATGDRIEFKRNGMQESLRATNGVETGMKWLSEKSDCLTVRAGEGYCRD